MRPITKDSAALAVRAPGIGCITDDRTPCVFYSRPSCEGHACGQGMDEWADGHPFREQKSGHTIIWIARK